MINRPEESYVGLFGKLYQASIRNIHLENVSITGQASVAGLAGYAYDSEIVLSSVDGVVGGEWAVGGLLGNAHGNVLINLSHSKGVVTGSSSNVGGLLGLLNANSEVTSSYSLSRVEGVTYSVGGLIGKVDYNNRISTSFSSGDVIGSGGLIGSLGKKNKIRDVFSSGRISLSSNTHSVAGVVSYVGLSNSISRALSVREVRGGRKRGGLVVSLEEPGDQIVSSYWSIDRSSQEQGDDGSNEQNFYGLDLESLKCPESANTNIEILSCLSDKDRSRNDLFSNLSFYKGWDVAYEDGVNVWDFGSDKELPGLVINNVIYRDSDGDGILDSDDERRFDSDNDGFDNELDDFKFNASAHLDTDHDGKPDSWLDTCNQGCQKNSNLSIDLDDDNDGVEDHLDAFPINLAAFADDDSDGLPDAWNSRCNIECQNASGLILDTKLNDSDNDGAINTLDKFPQNTDASIDSDNDGFPDSWNQTCDLTCQHNSILTLDGLLNDTDNDGVDNDIDHFIDNPAASQDTDGDGKPDDWHLSCDLTCQAGSGLRLDEDDDDDGVVDNVDAFSLIFAASQDVDGDGFPDYWHSRCGALCRDESNLILDISLFDTDNDGVENIVDAFINNPAASVDTDGDGKPDDWNEYCHLECQMASNLTLDEDDDNDGVRDENDAFPIDRSEVLDTDGDGIGNNADPDDDNDGVLDKNDSDIARDNGLPELIQVPVDLKLSVTSEDGAYAVLNWTQELHSQFRAYDIVDSYDLIYEARLKGVRVDIFEDAGVQLPSGHLELLWRAKDRAGNYSNTIAQKIDVYPRVRFSQAESIRGDESHADIEVELTGESPEYPVSVQFKVSLDKSDEDVNQEDFSEKFDIEAVHTLSIAGPCNDDSCLKPKGVYQIPIERNTKDEVNEQLTFELIGINEALESKDLFVIDNQRKEHMLTISYENLAPEVSLILERDGKVVTSPISSQDVIAVKAIIDDKNDSDEHATEWVLGGITNYTILKGTVYINTAVLPPGDYPISVNVSDLVENSLSGSAEITLTIANDKQDSPKKKDDAAVGSMNGLLLLMLLLLMVESSSRKGLIGRRL